ncbi:MAG: prepilin-type N-terminal cleavage/methylation domain-containing protein [Woeseiaceae bacterium]
MTGRPSESGMTLVEVLVAVSLLAVLLVPALHALHTGFVGAAVQTDHSRDHYRLVARIETVLADSYTNLEIAAAGPATPSSYSDAAGPADRILVFVAPYDADDADTDADPFTGADDGVLWVRVAIEGSVLDLVSLATR